MSMSDHDKIMFLDIALSHRENPIQALLDMECVDNLLDIQKAIVMVTRFQGKGSRAEKTNYAATLEKALDDHIKRSKEFLTTQSPIPYHE